MRAEATRYELKAYASPGAMQSVALYALTALAATSVFLPNVTAYFVADDWPVIARNVITSWQDSLQLLSPVRPGFYRPLFELFIALLWKLYGLNPMGYHLTILLLYALICLNVGILAELLTGQRRIGLLSTVLFAINSSHAEPVLWIASSNELLAGLFAVSGMTAYVKFRRSSKLYWLLVSGISYSLSIASKETAVFLPLALVAYDFWFHRPSGRYPLWRWFAPTGPFLALGLAFAVFRLYAGSPYSMAAGIPRIGVNLAYYLAVEVFALPDNYGYLTALTLWQREPLLPIVVVGLAAISLGIFARLFLRFAEKRFSQKSSIVLKFAIGWSLIALSPVFLTATGRTAFLSSVGVAWAIAIMFFALWESLPSNQGKRRWALVALALLVGTSLLVSSYRTYWWRQAGDTVQTVLAQLDDQLRDVPNDSEIRLLALPDHLRHAYTFRNAFPAVGELLYRGRNIHAALDVDLAGTAQQESAARASQGREGTVIFWYRNGTLERVR